MGRMVGIQERTMLMDGCEICGEKIKARGLCGNHYMSIVREGTIPPTMLDTPIPSQLVHARCGGSLAVIEAAVAGLTPGLLYHRCDRCGTPGVPV